MTGHPRHQRARSWAWLYLALFGPDDDVTEEPGPESNARADTDHERRDGPPEG